MDRLRSEFIDTDTKDYETIAIIVYDHKNKKIRFEKTKEEPKL